MRWLCRLILIACCCPLTLLCAQEPAAGPDPLARLCAIAAELHAPESDGVGLFTEAARLAGFAIWSEDRQVLADPLAEPRLHLAVTDAEIRAYVQMYRSGHSVALADLLAAMDHLWQGMGVAASCAPLVTQWRREAFLAGAPATRGLFTLLQALGVQRAGDVGCIDREGDIELDPLQALLLLRVLTEDLQLPLRRVLDGWQAEAGKQPRGPMRADEPAARFEWPGWAEDGYAGTVTTIVGKGLENLDSISKTVASWGDQVSTGGEKLSKGVSYANAISAVIKCIATYTFLRNELRVEDPGQPLIRTKSGPMQADAGEQRTLVARIYIDGTKVTDWMKDNRKLVALAGIDIDMPKSGALAGIETEWNIVEHPYDSRKHLVQAVYGTGDLSRIRTDSNGEARVVLEGRPQDSDLSKLPVLPVEKRVPVIVTPQAKTTEIKQDIVDAVFGALGVLSGPEGILVPVIETLYRMKWKGSSRLLLEVRDWEVGEVIGSAEITLSASGADLRRDAGLQINYDRTLRFERVQMHSTEIDVPTIDEKALAMMPATMREQVLEGRRQLLEAANHPSFHAMDRGHVTMGIHDRTGSYGSFRDCESMSFTEATTWTADLDAEFADPAASGRMFIVEFDRQKQTATLNLHMVLETKVHSVRTERAKTVTTETHDSAVELDIFSDLDLQPPFREDLVLPLKEVPNVITGGVDYYGVAAVPFKFGPDGKFSGTAHVSYTISRRPKPKPAQKPAKKRR